MTRQYVNCITYHDKGLRRDAPDQVGADLLEWRAIARFELLEVQELGRQRLPAA